MQDLVGLLLSIEDQLTKDDANSADDVEAQQGLDLATRYIDFVREELNKIRAATVETEATLVATHLDHEQHSYPQVEYPPRAPAPPAITVPQIQD